MSSLIATPAELVRLDGLLEALLPAQAARLLEPHEAVARWLWWLRCANASAMLRVAAPLVPCPLLVLAACDCAATVLHLVPAGEERPLLAIEAARAWARGEASIKQVHAAAANAAGADAYVAAAYAYVAAAYAAAAAAYAAAAYAAEAADAAAYAYQATMAALVRQRIGLADLAKGSPHG